MSIPAPIQSHWAFSASGTLIDSWRSQEWGTSAVLTAKLVVVGECLLQDPKTC